MSMKGYYRRAKFALSAAAVKQFPSQSAFEAAFVGRSNAGKSSALNTLCGQRSLARTSKTPGRTQLVNYFQLDDERYLVDLPGYGFAKVAISVRDEWHRLMEAYFSESSGLVGLVVVMDIRHPLKEYDWQMLEWCAHYDLQAHVLLTKSDKLKRGAAKNSLLAVRKALKDEGLSDVSVQSFSALKNDGVDELEAVLNRWYGLDSTEDDAS